MPFKNYNYQQKLDIAVLLTSCHDTTKYKHLWPEQNKAIGAIEEKELEIAIFL